jgi:hypothetical protein
LEGFVQMIKYKLLKHQDGLTNFILKKKGEEWYFFRIKNKEDNCWQEDPCKRTYVTEKELKTGSKTWDIIDLTEEELFRELL